MIHGPVQVALSPAEWRLICALREVPEGNLKRHVDRLLEELVHFLREPQCAKLTEMVDSLAIAHPRTDS